MTAHRSPLAADAGAAAPAVRTAVLPLLLLALAMAVGFTALGSFSAVQEAAKAELGMSDYALGLVQGVAAAVPLALFSVPIGRLVDRYNRVRLLLALAACWIAGAFATALAPSTGLLFAARMLTGIGATGALTATLSLGADLCPPAARGRAMLTVTLGKSAGIALGFALTGWLFGAFAGGWGGFAAWRAAHLALALIALATCLPLLFLAEPPRQEVAVAGAPLRVVMRELWGRRAFLAPLFVGQISVVMADNAAIVWSAPVLGRIHHLGPAQFSGWLGALLFATGVGGALIGGLAADWGQRGKRRGGVLGGALAAALVGIPMALFPVAGSVTSFAVLLGLLTLCGTITGLITSVALTVLLPNETRGVAIGLFIAVAGVIGFGVAPTLVAWVSALLGGEGHLAPALAGVGIATSVIAAGAFALAIRNAPRSATYQTAID